jgi:hypothetical protein
MSIGKLQGLSAQPPYDYETVEKVKGLLNSGQVDVNDVSNYFNVEKAFVIQSLTDIPPNAYTSGSLDAPQVAAVQKLIELGVASTKDVSQYFSAPEEIVERNLTEQLGYTPAQIAQARVGIPITQASPAAIAETPVEIAETPATGAEIQTGLLGSEQALTSMAQAAIDRLDRLNQQGRQDLANQYQQGLAQAAAAAAQARGDITAGTTQGLEALGAGFGQARQDITQGTAQGLEALGAGFGQARTDITDSFGRAEGMFDPYRQAGTTALQQQMALSGALGQDAFNQAYQESPQMAFLREQGMRANLSGAAATGGLGGGNVQKELQRFGQGLASQGLQQQIANLGALSGQGLAATGSTANIATGAGSNLANLASGEGQARLGALTNQGANLGNLATAEGTTRLQAATNQGSNLANIATGLGSQQLQTQANLGNQLSGYGLSTGLPAAQTLNNLGINLAQGRINEGLQQAQDQRNLANALAGIYQTQGTNLTGMIDSQRTMLMDLVNRGALTEAQAQQAYATNMANLQSGVGSQLAGVPNSPIFAPDYGAQIGDAFQAAGVGDYISRNRLGTTAGGAAPGAPVFQSQPITMNPGVMPQLPGGYGFQLPSAGGVVPALMPQQPTYEFQSPLTAYQIPQLGSL